MLHAIYHNKGCLWKRYLGHRDHLEGNVFAEDEITSAFLGTQDFLSSSDVWQIWNCIIGENSIFENIKEFPDSFEIRLWPRKEIEPDALITFSWNDGFKRYVLIEFKWDANVSGEDQLEKQWNYFLTDVERKNAVHLYISKNITAAIPYQYQWNIIPITWLHVRTALKHVKKASEISLKSGAILKYCDVMDYFMEKILILPFNGFKSLSVTDVCFTSENEYIFFKHT